MCMWQMLKFVLVLFCASYGDAARILVSFPPPAGSHFILGKALVEGLLARGHDVTFIHSFDMKERKGLTNIVMKDKTQFVNDLQKLFLGSTEKNSFQQFNQLLRDTYTMGYSVLNNTQIQETIKKDKYDLVILDIVLNEAHFALAHHFDCPAILVSSLGSNLWVNSYVGNPAPSSYVNQLFGGNIINMTFSKRVTNNIITFLSKIVYYGYHLPQQEEMLREFFPGSPSLDEIKKKRIALILLNSHPSISPAKPSVPSMIEIGGYHISDPKPLPKDLQTYLDNAKEGFILFSMGSILKSTSLPTKTRDDLMTAFSQLPYKILWKFEDDQLPGKPDNVRISKWLPQNDILAHPNLKLFITHGGLLSTTEAVYHGVPIVGIPIFADQTLNMAAAEALGLGKTIRFVDITSEKLVSTIKEVIHNKDYREAAEYRSALFRDQPIKPLDSAMYWIEYVLRHKYLEHLKVGSIHLTWYQEMSLDVIVFLCSILFALLFVLYFIITKCINKRTTSSVQQKKIQ